jgi:hypothetical protein
MVLRLVPLPVSAFGEIAALRLEVHVWCQRCKQARPVPLNSPALYGRSFAGSHFRCTRPLWDGSTCMEPAIQPSDRRRCFLLTRRPAWPTSIAIDAWSVVRPAGRFQTRALASHAWSSLGMSRVPPAAAGAGEAAGLAADLRSTAGVPIHRANAGAAARVSNARLSSAG